MSRRVDIREDIKSCQNIFSYALSKIDYSIGESIYMFPSDMNFNIKSETVGYNNKILISDGTFSLGKNDKVNTLTLKHTLVPKTVLMKVKALTLQIPRVLEPHQIPRGGEGGGPTPTVIS